MSETKKEYVSAGLDYPTCHNVLYQIKNLQTDGFDFALLPVVHPRNSRYEDVNRYRKFTIPEKALQNLSELYPDWQRLIAAKINCNFKEIESSHATTRKHAENLLNQELDYCTYLGITVVLVELINESFTNLARTLYANLTKSISYNIWLKVPMREPAVDLYTDRPKSEISTWHWWNEFRTIVNYNSKIFLALEVTEDLCDEEELQRWLGEPLKCVILATHLFQTNSRGFPVLNNALSEFIKKVLDLNLQVIITGVNRHHRYLDYVQYIHFLKKQTTSTEFLAMIAHQFEDYLQHPLQPLAQDLTSSTYECFEKDPVKYKKYQEAVYEVLLDRVPEDQAETVTSTIMVVGAGRGPLVTASLEAAKLAMRKVRIYAVEKNMNAVNGLLHDVDTIWAASDVQVISIDMRLWDPPEKADIMVSELLGSFGDNELSPECLYAAQRYLKKDGVSIPCEYNSYIAPVMSQKLYNEITNFKFEYKSPLFKYEQPYVVYQKNKYEIAPAQKLFTFVHPNHEPTIDNTRFEKLKFKTKQDCVLHGLSGYFDTILYKNITLSIHPETHTRDLISWFPVLFPIYKPIQLQAGDEIEVHFWRCLNKIDVWYEWLVSKPINLPIQNLNGCSYKINMS